MADRGRPRQVSACVIFGYALAPLPFKHLSRDGIEEEERRDARDLERVREPLIYVPECVGQRQPRHLLEVGREFALRQTFSKVSSSQVSSVGYHACHARSTRGGNVQAT